MNASRPQFGAGGMKLREGSELRTPYSQDPTLGQPFGRSIKVDMLDADAAIHDTWFMDWGRPNNTLMTTLTLFGHDAKVPSFFHSSYQNEMAGVARRVLADDGTLCDTESHEWGVLLNCRDTFIKSYIEQFGKRGPRPIPDVLVRYHGQKFRRYERANEILIRRGFRLCKRDSFLDAFVKAERHDDDGKNKPRMIHVPKPVYALTLASCIKNIEAFVYVWRSDETVSKGPVIVKGWANSKKASVIKSRTELFNGPFVVISIDASSFDSHVRAEMLRVEHSVYTGVFEPGHDGKISLPFFKEILEWQTERKAKTSHGITYTCMGGRASGDMNTAVGNCVIMTLMVMAYGRILREIDPTFRYDTLGDGDDVLVFMSVCHENLFKTHLHRVFGKFGFKMRIDKVAHRLQDILFCQHNVVLLGPEMTPHFVRDPLKTIRWSLATTRLADHKTRVSRVLSIGLCLWSINVGVPVLEAYALAIIRICGYYAIEQEPTSDPTDHYYLSRLKTRFELQTREEVQDKLVELSKAEKVATEFSVSDRYEFAEAFPDLDPGTQEYYEDQLSTWRFDMFDDEYVVPFL